MIDLVAVHEEDHVGVLLDGTGFPQVGGDWPLVGTLFAFAGELAQQHDRNAQFLGEQLAAATDTAHLFSSVAALAFQQLQVVDHQQVQAVTHLVAAGQ
ncbi:hypothetical protein D3C76_1302020 [compost metagenome]